MLRVRKLVDRWRTPFSAWLLLVLPLLPSLNLLFPVGFVLAERVLYLPSLGACALAAILLSVAWSRAGRLAQSRAGLARATLFGSFVAMIVAAVGHCLAQNTRFRSAELLYRSSIA